jgi:hypothetical protein
MLGEVDVTANYRIVPVSGKLAVTTLTGDDRIEITVTANSASADYDGTAKSVSGYGVIWEDDNTYKAQLSGLNASATRTIPGETAVKFEGIAKVTLNGTDVTANYNIVLVPGTLKINELADGKKITVIVTANSGTFKYTGAAHTVSGIKSIEGLPAGTTLSGLEVPEVSRRATGTTPVVFTGIGVLTQSGEDVTENYNIVLIPGELTITPIEEENDKITVIVTANSGTYVYNGTAHTVNGIATVTSLAEGAALLGLGAEATRTIPGTTSVTITGNAVVMQDGVNVSASYNIVRVPGTLTVKSTGITVDLTAENAPDDAFKKVYGEPDPGIQAIAAAIQAQVNAQLRAQGLPADDIIVTVENRIAGETVKGSSYVYSIKWENKGNYEFTEEEISLAADLTITQRPIAITAASKNQEFNGSALTNSQYTITNGTLANNETIDRVTITGSQTSVGSSDNIPSEAVILDAEGKNVTENYIVTYIKGELKVTEKNVPGGGGGGKDPIVIPPIEVPTIEKPKGPELLSDSTEIKYLETGEHRVYINGYPDETVRPNRGITRAEVATIFFRLLQDTYQNGTANTTFSDVKADAWYSEAIAKLAQLGIIKGYEDGTFKPNNQITRAEFAAIASRFAQLSKTDNAVFSDVPATYWAYQEINSAYAKGWVNGYEDGTFRPGKNITRAEVAKLVNTMLNRLPKELPDNFRNPYTDIDTTHWAYIHIMEASTKHDYQRTTTGVEIWAMFTCPVTGKELWNNLNQNSIKDDSKETEATSSAGTTKPTSSTGTTGTVESTENTEPYDPQRPTI